MKKFLLLHVLTNIIFVIFYLKFS